MTRRLSALLALLLAAAALAPAPAPAAAADDARALVDSLAARYPRFASYRFEGVVLASATGPRLPQAQSFEIPFRYAAVRPSKVHSDVRHPMMPSRVVADGESLWVFAPTLGQYTVQRAPDFSSGAALDPAVRSFDGALAIGGGLTEGIAGVRSLGPDTVRTAAGPVACRRVELSYAPDSTRPGARVLPRVLWIDEARGLLLRDSSTTEITHAQFGEVRQVQEMRFALAETGRAVPDSLFRFTPPADAKRVRRIGAGANDPDDAGKPAQDFSLAVLDGKGGKVTLSAQRGKVVVLDFWATWCGPCRRWMPIVAKLEKETAGKDVRFYAVNLHEPPATVRAYVKAQKVAVPVLMDADGKVSTAYGASSIPLTVVVGRDGKIVRSLLGVHPEEDLRDALREAGVEGL